MAAVTTVAQLCARIDTVAERLDTVAERLDGQIREVNARLDSVNREMNARFDSVNRQLRWMQACLLVVLAMMIAIHLRI